MENELAKVNLEQMPVQTQKQGNLSVFADAKSFELACRMADSLSRSTIVPKDYRGNPSNCMIAIEMASRINTSPMMVMQNLYIVNGNPAWSSQWIIAMINNSRRYKTELKFDMGYTPDGHIDSCTAWAEDYNGNRVIGPKITMEMANKEGWISKNGSKWKTMPEVMIRYRAASFFGRLNCPDMIMGIYSQDEVIDGLGDPIDEATGEVVDVGEDRQITQEERQAFMQSAMDVIDKKYDTKEDKNNAYIGILNAVGLKSTTNMTERQLERAMEIVNSIRDSDDVQEDVAENAAE